MKILFCTDGIFPYMVGGMQRHSRLLIEELANDPTIELAVIHPHQQKIFTSFQNVKEYIIQPVDVTKNYLRQCYLYSKQVHAVAVSLPDHIIYSQGLSVWYRINDLKNRLIINPHGLEPYQAIGFKAKLQAIPFKWIFTRLFKKAACTISLGGKLTNILGHRARSVAEIPNAVLANSFSRKSPESCQPIKFLFVGRFAHNKGIGILMAAIEKLKEVKTHHTFQFYLAGKGPLFDTYRSKFLSEDVHFAGFVSDEDLTEYYKSCDVFVLPTLFEGMPTVVLEAMSFGMPIIVTHVGATALQVDETNGFLIKTNDVNALVAAFQKIDVWTNEQWSRASISSVNKIESFFTWKVVAEAHQKLFARIAENVFNKVR
ncbi:MAG: glycosyltransferase family 4 protein [Flavobacteriales bacterium]